MAIPLPEARSAFLEKESASESLEKRPKRRMETDFRAGPGKSCDGGCINTGGLSGALVRQP